MGATLSHKNQGENYSNAMSTKNRIKILVLAYCSRPVNWNCLREHKLSKWSSFQTLHLPHTAAETLITSAGPAQVKHILTNKVVSNQGALKHQQENNTTEKKTDGHNRG